MPPKTPSNITVWLIEDNRTFRDTVSRVIEKADDMTCPFTFPSCETALSALGRESAPDVILLDVGLPGMSGIEGITRIKELSPGTHAIILTVFDNKEKVVRAICAGASGYLAGRATWWNVFSAFPNLPAVIRTLEDDSAPFLAGLSAYADENAAPWTKHAAFAPEGPVLAHVKEQDFRGHYPEFSEDD